MSYNELYEHLALNGPTNKGEAELIKTINNIEKLRRDLQKRGK